MLNTMIGKKPRQTVKRALAGYNKLASSVPGMKSAPTDESARILMYHSVHPKYPGSVTPEMFEKQMALLASEYLTCPLTEIPDYQKGSVEKSSKRNVVVTFDDGYQDVLRFALPVLEHYNIPATVFMCTRYIDESEATLAPPESGMYKGLEVMTWLDLDRLVKSELIQLGSHTHSHVELRGLSVERLKEEIETPKHMLESRLGVDVRSFAYPWGQRFNFDDAASEAVSAGGFELAVSTVWGPATKNSDRFVLPRIRVDNVDDIQDFTAKLEGQWDYIAAWHRLNSWAKRRRN